MILRILLLFESERVFVDLKKLFNISLNEKKANYKPAFMLILLGVIIVGFGYGLNQHPVYEEVEPPLYNKGTAEYELTDVPKKKKRRHHHKNHEDEAFTNSGKQEVYIENPPISHDIKDSEPEHEEKME